MLIIISANEGLQEKVPMGGPRREFMTDDCSRLVAFATPENEGFRVFFRDELRLRRGDMSVSAERPDLIGLETEARIVGS